MIGSLRPGILQGLEYEVFFQYIVIEVHCQLTYTSNNKLIQAAHIPELSLFHSYSNEIK